MEPTKWERATTIPYVPKKLNISFSPDPGDSNYATPKYKVIRLFPRRKALPPFHHSLWIPISKSDEMETSCWEDCHSALNTLFLWALIERDGLGALYRISKMWITGSEEPDEMCKPSGDQDWLISADCDSLLSCFHPKENSSVWGNLTSYNRSCLSSCLQAK